MFVKYETRVNAFIVASLMLFASVVGAAAGFQYADSRFQEVESEVQTRQEVVYLNSSAPTPEPATPKSESLNSVFRASEDSVVSITGGSASGSGFVYRPNGIIVTNQHVVEGQDEVNVQLTDGSTLEAEIMGTDPYTDLAALKIDRRNMTPLRLGNSSAVKPGQTITAIGNPFGLRGSMTSGIVSQVGRLLPVQGDFSIPNVIQTDAAINPGNSGGPLLNMQGRVVGVNTAIESRTGTFSGVGFAIPSDTVRRVVPELVSDGEYNHPWLGVSGRDLNPEISRRMDLDTTAGFLVVSVVDGGPSDGALRARGNREVINGQGIRLGGDVIVAIDGERMRGISDILTYLDSETKVGETITVTVIRDGERQDVEVAIQERPEA